MVSLIHDASRHLLDPKCLFVVLEVVIKYAFYWKSVISCLNLCIKEWEIPAPERGAGSISRDAHRVLVLL